MTFRRPSAAFLVSTLFGIWVGMMIGFAIRRRWSAFGWTTGVGVVLAIAFLAWCCTGVAALADEDQDKLRHFDDWTNSSGV